LQASYTYLNPEKTKLITEVVDDILSDGAEEWFTYDRSYADAKGRIILRWKQTGSPIAMPIEITQNALDKKSLHAGELRRNIKWYLPKHAMRQLISEANSLLRGASRRHLPDVTKDLSAWVKKTSDQITNMFGHEVAADFLKEVPLPATFKRDTIQALQYLIEIRVERLRNL